MWRFGTEAAETVMWWLRGWRWTRPWRFWVYRPLYIPVLTAHELQVRKSQHSYDKLLLFSSDQMWSDVPVLLVHVCNCDWGRSVLSVNTPVLQNTLHVDICSLTACWGNYLVWVASSFSWIESQKSIKAHTDMSHVLSDTYLIHDQKCLRADLKQKKSQCQCDDK